MAAIQTHATIRCPRCGVESNQEMPLDACQIAYRCESCGTTLRPKAGDCCVFCSYGSLPCPPKQEEQTG